MLSFTYAMTISLATIPIPFIGLKLFFPLAILLALINHRRFSLVRLLISLIILTSLSIMCVAFKNEPSKVLIVVYCAISVSFILFDFKIKAKDWIRVGYFQIVFFVLSIISILVLDTDLIAQFIYGESRHSTGAFSLVKFRGSGLYQEPSTFAYHLIGIAFALHLISTKDVFYSKITLLFFSLLSFSAAAVVSLVFLSYLAIKSPLKFKVKLAILVFISPAFVWIGYIVVEFLLYKINVYSQMDLSMVTRFQAVNLFYEQLPIFGLDEETLKNNVVFDLGPIFSSILIFGVLAIPVGMLLTFCCFKSPMFLCLIVTKIPLTDPLLWFLANKIIDEKRVNEV